MNILEPILTYSVSPTTTIVTSVLQFAASFTFGDTVLPFTLVIDYNDGTSDTITGSSGTVLNKAHSYSAAGVYLTTATLSSSNGYSTSQTISVNITGKHFANFTIHKITKILPILFYV